MKQSWLQKITFVMIVFGILLSPCFGDEKEQADRWVIGKSVKIHSKILAEERPLWVYLPTGYSESKEQYPVFYLLDGKVNFHHISGIVEILGYYRHIPRMIVVAVENTDRERDFLPFKTEDDWPPTAGADKFRAFLKKELIPFVEKNYRTFPYRILCGHSFGAVFCFDVFLKEPGLFTAYIAAAASISVNNRLLLRQTKSKIKHLSPAKTSLFFTISKDDGESIDACKDLARYLEKNAPKELSWRFDYMETEDHVSVLHPTVFNALRWLHRDWRLPETTAEKMSLDDIKAHYRQLSERYGSKILVPEGMLIEVGYGLIEAKKFARAIEAFKYYVEIYPDSAIGHVCLGEAYEEGGKFELAKKYYEISLKMAIKNKDNQALPVGRGLLKRLLKKMEDK